METKKTLNARGHCKLCKSWKVNGVRTERLDGERYSDHKRRAATALDIDLATVEHTESAANMSVEELEEMETDVIRWFSGATECLR